MDGPVTRFGERMLLVDEWGSGSNALGIGVVDVDWIRNGCEDD